MSDSAARQTVHFLVIVLFTRVLLSMGSGFAYGLGSNSCEVDGAAARSGILINGICVPVRGGGPSGDAAQTPVTRSVGCRADGSSTQTGSPCGSGVPRCTLLVQGGSATPDIVAYAVQQQDPKTKQWITVDFWCPQSQRAVPAGPSAASIRDQALKLLPKVAIGTTGTANTSLVNVQTVLWADTPATRVLGTVTIVGHRVALRAGFARADWRFGDGQSDTTATPGAPYDDARNPCDTPTCTGYYGHTYTATGPQTITLTVSWNASYSLDGGPYQPVGAAAITGAPATRTVTVHQARGILVPDPGN